MARQQFEDKFRDKLGNREIKPSEGGWDQLSGRLDSAEKKSTPYFWWAGIAAGIVGAILIYSLVFTNNLNNDTPVIVDAPSEQTSDEENIVGKEDVQVVSEEKVKENVSEDPEDLSEKNEIPKTNTAVTKTANQVAVASAEKETEQVVEEDILAESGIVEESRIQSKLEEAIAAVSSTAIDQDATDAEINALLYKAATEISMEETRDYTTGTVDANDLLFDVEMELEESFRNKVFDLLKDGYTKARSAVANRN